MIPVDLAARLRLLTEASFFQIDKPVHELNPAREIPKDLPDFTPGQRLTATIDRPLAEGLFQAIVVGKVVTLAINTPPDAAPPSPGQTLALEVTRSTPQVLHAEIVPLPLEAADIPPALSQTARLISTLLTGQPDQEPTPLAAGKPLLPSPPTSAAPVVPALKEALSQSGMFYEAHQAQWVAGKFNIETLRMEPQGQLSMSSAPPLSEDARAPSPPAMDVTTLRDTPAQPSVVPSRVTPERSPSLTDLARELIGLEPKSASTTESPARPGAPPSLAPIPERILPLVGQQLDALATQQFVWHGQIWPGQSMEWEIEDPTGSEGDEQPEGRNWNTTLRLTLPQLGSIEARLTLNDSGVTIRLLAREPGTQAALAADQATLAQGLDSAHIPLLGLSVEPVDGDQ